MSDITDLISRLFSPVSGPVKKIYRRHRRNTIFRNDFILKYNAAMPKLTRAQRKEIDDFYGAYGFNMEEHYNSYRFLYAASGVFSPRYIPEKFYWKTVQHAFNSMEMAPAWSDKCYLDMILPSVQIPSTVIRNISGLYFDRGYKSISEDDAVAIAQKYEKLIIKPSTGSWGGRGIKIYRDMRNVRETLMGYGSNFAVQEVIGQHPVMASFNASSVNTVRIMSFYFKGEVRILFSCLRVGHTGADIDNMSSGGCALAVGDDGRVRPGAREYEGWPAADPDVLSEKDEIKVPSYGEMIALVKQNHLRFPHFGLIAWDLTVDTGGRPLVVELNFQNAGIKPFQLLCGPMFGDITEEVLRRISEYKASH